MHTSSAHNKPKSIRDFRFHARTIRGKFFLIKQYLFFLTCFFSFPRSEYGSTWIHGNWHAGGAGSCKCHARTCDNYASQLNALQSTVLCVCSGCSHTLVHWSLQIMRARPCVYKRRASRGRHKGEGSAWTCGISFQNLFAPWSGRGGIAIADARDGVWRQHLRVSGAARVCTLHNSSQLKFSQISNINYPAKDWFVRCISRFYFDSLHTPTCMHAFNAITNVFAYIYMHRVHTGGFGIIRGGATW